MKKAVLLFLIALVVACSADTRKQLGVAHGIAKEMGATSVQVSSTVTTADGHFTTLTFSGLNRDLYDDAGMFQASHYAAFKFIDRITPEEFGNDTMIKVKAKMSNGQHYDYKFSVPELMEAKNFIPVADAFITACMEFDTLAVSGLCHPQYLPDSTVSQLHEIIRVVDSAYAGEIPRKTMKGFMYDEARSVEGLKMYSTIYYVETDKWLTRYTINLDRETKKVVYFSANSKRKE